MLDTSTTCAPWSRDVWRRPGAFDRICGLPMGAVPASFVSKINALEAVIHAWDISQATVECAEISDELARPLLTLAREILQDPRLRVKAYPIALTPVSTSAADQLLAVCGRVSRER